MLLQACLFRREGCSAFPRCDRRGYGILRFPSIRAVPSLNALPDVTVWATLAARYESLGPRCLHFHAITLPMNVLDFDHDR